MFNLGLFELGLFGIIALIVLGPDKLPKAARTLGKYYALLVHAKNRLTHDMMTELELLETQEQIKKELATLRQSENAIKAQMMNLERSIAKNEQQILSLDSTSPDSTADTSANPQNPKAPYATTAPMTYRFFLLGDFDKKKRLPPAPFLPNTKAERLLYQFNTANNDASADWANTDKDTDLTRPLTDTDFTNTQLANTNTQLANTQNTDLIDDLTRHNANIQLTKADLTITDLATASQEHANLTDNATSTATNVNTADDNSPHNITHTAQKQTH